MNAITKGERVLVTGGSGSLGSALIPRLLEAGAQVRVLSRDDQKQTDLRRTWPDVECWIGDVRDAARVADAMRGVETVIHAASLKLVPEGERQPTEYALTNVLGTANVLAAARFHESVRRCVGISTDKCVAAVNVYGHTKALLERFFIESSAMTFYPEKSFTVARYGNVVASRGSVIPYWSAQRKRGEALHVTDPAMTRFMFTMAAAIALVDVALEAPSGTIVAQPMPACTLGQLARIMSPPEQCSYEVVGRRPGEKIHEELLTAEEMSRTVFAGGHFYYGPRGSVQPGEPTAYTSYHAPRLTDNQLRDLIEEWL
jgi:UDP-glucose 4-epimerase